MISLLEYALTSPNSCKLQYLSVSNFSSSISACHSTLIFRRDIFRRDKTWQITYPYLITPPLLCSLHMQLTPTCSVVSICRPRRKQLPLRGYIYPLYAMLGRLSAVCCTSTLSTSASSLPLSAVFDFLCASKRKYCILPTCCFNMEGIKERVRNTLSLTFWLVRKYFCLCASFLLSVCVPECR
jgi:hypothetical protein